MTNVAFSDGISNCKCFFSWQVVGLFFFFVCLVFMNLIVGQLLTSGLDVQQICPLWSLFSLRTFTNCHSTVQCLFSRTLSWCKSAPFCEHQQSFASSHQLQTGFWAPGALGSREAMKQDNGKNILKVSSDLCLHSLKMRFELQPPTMNSELLTARFALAERCVRLGLQAARTLLCFRTRARCSHEL